MVSLWLILKPRDHASDVVKFSKYAPIGQRGFSPFTRAGGYGMQNVTTHATVENDETMVGVIIEGRKGIDNLDVILEAKHLDIVYIGAYDLSQSLGIPGQVNHRDVKDKYGKMY